MLLLSCYREKLNKLNTSGKNLNCLSKRQLQENVHRVHHLLSKTSQILFHGSDRHDAVKYFMGYNPSPHVREGVDKQNTLGER